MSENQNQDQKTPVASVKGVMVKRIKVPTINASVPSPAAPAVTGSASSEAQSAASVTSAPQPIIQPVTTDSEPPLPPDDKSKASEAAKDMGSSRKRRREAIQSGDAFDNAAKRKAQEAIEEAKNKASSMWNNKLVRFGIFISIICILLGYGYSKLPVLAEKKLPEIFEANGLKLQRFNVKELTISTIELTNIADKSNSMAINSMRIDYSLGDLLFDNKINSLTVKGLTLNGVRRDDGISLGAFNSLLSSSIQVKKDKEIILPRFSIQASNFNLKYEGPEKLDAEGNPVNQDATVGFSANGSLMNSKLTMNIQTSYDVPGLRFKTESSLVKSQMSADIKTEITEGDLLKGEEVIGSVKGTMDFSMQNGVLTKGLADLAVQSASQKLDLNAEVIPLESGFDLTLKIKRSFEDMKDAVDKFVGDLEIEAKNIQMNGTVHKFSGHLPLTVKSASLTNGNIAVQGLDISTDFQLNCNEGKCAVNLMKPMNLSFGSAIFNTQIKQFKFFQPLSVTINPDKKDPLMTVDGGYLNFMLPMSGFTTQIFVTDQMVNQQIAMAMNMSKLRLRTNIFADGYSGDFAFAQSSFADKNMVAKGVRGTLTFKAGSLPSGRFTIAEATLKNANSFPDFSAEVAVRPMRADELKVQSRLLIQNGLVRADVDGSYALLAHKWDLSVNVPKVILSEAGLPLESVLPFVANKLSKNTTGAFAIKGRVVIDQDKISGPISLLLDNITTKWNGIDFNGVSGVLTLSSLLPIETAENQLLYVGSLNPGLPLNNATINFKVNANSGVQVASARASFADGHFKTIKSFFYPFEGTPAPILMEGSDINLAAVSKYLKSSALQADGTFNSEWKLSFAPTGLIIDQAKILTKLPGTIHFDPSNEIKKQMDGSVVKFLKEVIVKQMGMTLKGPMNGEVSFKTKINGRSPLEENDSTITFEFKNSFANLFKTVAEKREIPSDVTLEINNY